MLENRHQCSVRTPSRACPSDITDVICDRIVTLISAYSDIMGAVIRGGVTRPGVPTAVWSFHRSVTDQLTALWHLFCVFLVPLW